MFQTSIRPLGAVYERWDDIEFKDKEIVWLPMVIIEKDDNDKWIGWHIRSCMTISVLILLSRIINIQNYQHHHCGINVLVFEATVVGYMEALLFIE
ncbi:hypothetical protein KY284_010217 [Solanum tuberosum]|nr:hypothetical protein KY284_010217 [Solanum tuberosum]